MSSIPAHLPVLPGARVVLQGTVPLVSLIHIILTEDAPVMMNGVAMTALYTNTINTNIMMDHVIQFAKAVPEQIQQNAKSVTRTHTGIKRDDVFVI